MNDDILNQFRRQVDELLIEHNAVVMSAGTSLRFYLPNAERNCFKSKLFSDCL